jgi:putative transposase
MVHRRRHHKRTDTTTQPPQTQGSTGAEMDAVDEQLAAHLVEQARSEGISLVGPDGLLQRLTKLVLEGALEGELTDHLGYEHGDPAGRNGGNSRNGTRAKTVLTEVGPVDLDVPRDRDASFQPKIVRKRQRRLTGMDDLVISLVAKGLTTGEGQAHLAEVSGSESPARPSPRSPTGCLTAWPPGSHAPGCGLPSHLPRRHPGQDPRRAGRQPARLRRPRRERGRRARHPGAVGRRRRRGAKYRLQVLTEIKHRGVADACIVVCDGLAGLPDAISAVWPQALTQRCIVHLLRTSFRYASRRDWAAIARDLRPVSTAPTEAAALDGLAAFAAAWEARYPAIIKLWEHAWAEFVPFLACDLEIRTVIATTNAIERLNARFRRSVKARGHVPNEQAALTHLYLTIVSLDPPAGAAGAGPTAGRLP